MLEEGNMVGGKVGRRVVSVSEGVCVGGWGGCVVTLGCQRIDGSMHERVVESLTQWGGTKEIELLLNLGCQL
jgi:hypothetical protein